MDLAVFTIAGIKNHSSPSSGRAYINIDGNRFCRMLVYISSNFLNLHAFPFLTIFLPKPYNFIGISQGA